MIRSYKHSTSESRHQGKDVSAQEPLSQCSRAPERGFTYIGLLLAVALMGVALAGVGTLWSVALKRDKEAQLLFAGDQFRQAITAYYESTPAGQMQRLPASFDELLEDRRWPTVRRHLRQIYVDPMTDSRGWGIVRGPGETIAGVYSPSTAAPLKRANFPTIYEHFAEAKTYGDWQFTASLQPRGLEGATTSGDRPSGSGAAKGNVPQQVVDQAPPPSARVAGKDATAAR
jgi:type II secretory pathway pseudopilin PulG